MGGPLFCIVITTMDHLRELHSTGFSLSSGGEQESPRSYRLRGSLENQTTLTTVMDHPPRPTGVCY